jgi:hypothetical protein
MSPDYPRFKSRMSRRLLALFNKEVEARAPLVAQIRVVARHEGNGGSYETEDGEIKEMNLQQTTVPIELPTASIPSLEIDELVQRVKDLAEAMARKKTRALLAAVDAMVEEAGTAVEAPGQPLTAELMLKAWDTMDIAFDENGNPELPTTVLNPIQGERFKEQLRRLDAEPDLIRRRREIIDRQRLDWYDRESRRKLVD